MIICRKNVMIFGIESVMVLKKRNSESIYSTKSLKTKTRSYGVEASDFHSRKIPEAGSD